MLVGLLGNAVLPDGLGFGVAFQGLAIAFVLHFGLHVLGLEGAGDGKMMMAVGAFLGWETMIEATLWRYLLLLPYAVIALTVLRRWGQVLAVLLWLQAKAKGVEDVKRPEATKLPFGPVIAFVVPLAMQTNWMRVWEW